MSNDFLIEAKSKVFKTSDDPMMRSGLVFSGANKSWGKVNENLLGDDGILTASEISNLDLSACQLVVLSACETGLGEVKGSEGVFGLQRAFKMAGVKNIIMSLWKVPDAQTAELFDTFYSECFAGKTIHEAFQSAQSQMKAKYSPYYWAGFVLLE
jgi:CHAT domain-containing protein